MKVLVSNVGFRRIRNWPGSDHWTPTQAIKGVEGLKEIKGVEEVNAVKGVKRVKTVLWFIRRISISGS